MLHEAVELGVEAGAHEIVIGMAHRGRLNVLAHIIDRPYEEILREFEGERTIEAVAATAEGASGDVKYHLGAVGRRATHAGQATVMLAANPSHLEAVDPVVEGITRAEQTDRSSRAGVHDPAVAQPILIHGDASFPGQGVVAETLNLQRLIGYTTGGTLHVIANNQVGFTTDPADGRSTRYSSDLAKGFDNPIIHVNADDPEAAISAIRLATRVPPALRKRRRRRPRRLPPARPQRGRRARVHAAAACRADRGPPERAHALCAAPAESGEVAAEEAERLVEEMQDRMRAAHETLKTSLSAPPQAGHGESTPVSAEATVETGVPAERLRELSAELVQVPEGFTVNPKLVKMLERRIEALDTGGIDWGQAESLAFASLLVEGIPIRLTGQDTERGTFSHRHLVLHDAHTGAQHAPIKHLSDSAASFEAYNSPLSEYAALGFEYGYSVTAPEALVLWEAQFGDFVNGAQIVVDQFLVSGLAKWRQTSRLTLLLPHGYEGNGPEHSSARLERFLQLAAQENIRIVNATTSAQYFHLLRRQALDPNARPLVVMTPKGLLRLKDAASTLAELADGRFEPVLDDPNADHERVTRLVLTTGKLYYDIVGHELRAEAQSVALARIEQLYPFPVEEAARLVASYPRLEEVVWAQEEPQNMGAWRPIRHRLEEAVAGRPLRLRGPALARQPERGLPDLPRARPGPDRARRPTARRALPRRRRRRCRSTAAFASRGPCFRASAMIRRRCSWGMRRQTSNAVRAIPTGPILRVNKLMRRGMARILATCAPRPGRLDLSFGPASCWPILVALALRLGVFPPVRLRTLFRLRFLGLPRPLLRPGPLSVVSPLSLALAPSPLRGVGSRIRGLVFLRLDALPGTLWPRMSSCGGQRAARRRGRAGPRRGSAVRTRIRRRLCPSRRRARGNRATRASGRRSSREARLRDRRGPRRTRVRSWSRLDDDGARVGEERRAAASEVARR